MSDPATEPQLDEFLEIRKPGAHLEEGVIADDFVLMLGVDLVNFPKFPKLDDTVTYPRRDLDIRYELDPFKVPAFEAYARAWGEIIPRCGADLIGYYAPHEGSATTAYAAYNIASLAEYERYRALFATDPEFAAADRIREESGCVRRFERTFLRPVFEGSLDA